MSATRQSQQSPPSTESRSSSKASWAAKKSPALKSRTPAPKPGGKRSGGTPATLHQRSEEHTSKLQSQSNLVCRLLLEKKKNMQPLSQRHPQSPEQTYTEHWTS